MFYVWFKVINDLFILASSSVDSLTVSCARFSFRSVHHFLRLSPPLTPTVGANVPSLFCRRTHSSGHDSSITHQILWNVQRKLQTRITLEALLLGSGESERLTPQ